MKLGPEHHVPENFCLDCLEKLDMATCVGSDATASPGDFTICIKCGHIMRFDEKMRLCNLTDEEIYMIAGDKRLVAVQNARAAIKREDK